MRERHEYLALRRRYQPKDVKLVIVAESPPASGRDFYCPDGETTEPLYCALMKHLEITPASKHEGLCAFQKRGWILVDATYTPVNGMPLKDRNQVIRDDFEELCQDLSGLPANGQVPVALIKANVCRILEPLLEERGFKVKNKGQVVYFPSNGRQTQFAEQFKVILA